MQRCVGDGYDRQIAFLASRGAFEVPRLWSELAAVEATYGEDSSAAIAFIRNYDSTPTDDDLHQYRLRRRAARALAKGNRPLAAFARGHDQFMRPLRPDLLTRIRARLPLRRWHRSADGRGRIASRLRPWRLRG